jgi:MarR family 2-MHQ and catechol resistance regulon transcriptional repressor
MARLVHRTGQEAAAALREHGLTPAQFQLLLAVRDRPGAVQRELGERFAVTGANVSMLVAKLESAGLLHRRADGAANRVLLTPAGQALVDRLEPEQSAFMAGRFAALGEVELDQLHALVRAALDGTADPVG